MFPMLSVVIQAGGQSSRMGSDKALIPLAGTPLIEHVLAHLAGLGDETLITTNNHGGLAYLGLPLVPDSRPGAGALFGLQTALQAAHGTHVLLAACDMPFLQRPLLEQLVALSSRADAVVPRREGRYEPLLAVYARARCLSAVQQALEAGERRMIGFFSQVEVFTLDEDQLGISDPEGLSFFNINTPRDLRTAEALLAAGKPHRSE